jgi:hypothetical protein
VTIRGHNAPVDIRELLKYRAQYIILEDCEVSNIQLLIAPDFRRPVFLIRNPRFIGVSSDVSSEVEKHRHTDETTGSTDYWFGTV